MDLSKYKLELSTKIVIEEALRRNIKVEILDEQGQFIRLRKGDKVEYIKQATKTSIDSYVVPLIMENKEVTKIILREHGINVPGGISVSSEQEAIVKWSNYKGQDIVVKPKSTNFGEGVQILKANHTLEDYKVAIEQALTFDSSVMIEEFVTGKEYRFLVIADEVVAILHRIPANVIGDGVSTIEELIRAKNDDPLRGTGHVTPFEKIQLGAIERENLRMQGKTASDVPEQGQIIYLRENSNVSTGGDSIDFTDDIPTEYKEIAIKAVKAVGAKMCGLDMMIDDINAKPSPDNYSIIELNFNPAIYLHNFPYKGINRQVEKKVLDAIGFSESNC
ncbi:bifunctional glutamate--cysteine ligase GshA/glutathione synthetase GshB [Desulfuribacillus alkaliarsenatis]|uniref:Carboxylate--amine ligase n=1 Tax=Desulfuribacillus alkaliarsenatis TaxID=766136 RepID=A0A1E5G3A0_9FIRM|nr:bifunctional glutamate--cysteine ligase GshA/glutathione synthetase GshB [Desulfuribacillus alkaliarsenatis]OEF97464.1 carboxylate--amine ligase [Desulfuribacillus alkaliarsenatis]